MDVFSDLKLLEVLLALLPGFLTAEIVGGLVLRQERSNLDRMIQALIYAFLSYVLWNTISGFFPNSATTHLLGLALSAITLGLLLSWVINTGYVHSLFRTLRITQATSRPNEWYDAFYDKKEHVILHLVDGRRIFGWPLIYSFRSDKGHVLLEGAEWLDRSEKGAKIRSVDMLINVAEIRFVEFLPPKMTETNNE